MLLFLKRDLQSEACAAGLPCDGISDTNKSSKHVTLMGRVLPEESKSLLLLKVKTQKIVKFTAINF